MRGTAFALACCLSLAACSSITAPLYKTTAQQRQVYQNERFQSDETFSRLFDAKVEATCEAARRALLSQGYVITRAEAGVVNGAKRFQPEGEVHVEIAFNVVCVPEGKAGALSTAFVSAQQDRYAVKKSTNATSIGVSAIGSIFGAAVLHPGISRQGGVGDHSGRRVLRPFLRIDAAPAG